MPLVGVDDPRDPRIAEYTHLSDGELLHDRGLFVAEGRLVVERLLTRSALRVRSLLLTAAARAALAPVLAARADDVPVYLVPQAIMNAVTGFNIHRGCLALGERPAPPPLGALLAALPPDSTLLVLEGVGDADNVGSLFRNAAALGGDAVIVGPGCADPLYRKAIRTSMGAAVWLPWSIAVEWPAALDALGEAGVTIVALTPGKTAEDVADVSRPPGRVALLLGSEGAGLSDTALGRAAHRVRIPMRGEVDSLNVATAAAIALYALGAK